MAEAPWLTIVGLGEDGPDGLPPASRDALATAEIVMGPERHLALLPDLSAQRVPWPRPFAEGLPILLGHRGRRVAVLASGDPFWFGAGSVLAREFSPGEWRALPGPSCFSLAAACLGWPLEETTCLALHAAPLSRLRPHLAPGARLIVTLRDGPAAAALAAYLQEAGAGHSRLWLLEALGGPRQRVHALRADEPLPGDLRHPICAAIEIAGTNAPLTWATGRADTTFEHDGQITKRPVRALALSALAPRPGERLWDLGAGSGSIALEWLLCHPRMEAVAVERDETRAARIRRNADALGQDRLQIVSAPALKALETLPQPDAVFVGGGLDAALLDRLVATVPAGTRLVAHAVTLETEALLASAYAQHGGDLLRIELAQAAPLGPRRGWKAAYPVVQWVTVL